MSKPIIIDPKLKMEIVFSGSGGAYAYYFGICEVLQKNFDLSEILFSSVSGGCFPPIFLLSQKNIPGFFQKIQTTLFNKLSKTRTGSFFNWNKIVYETTKDYFKDIDINLINKKIIVKTSKIDNILNPYSWKDTYFDQWNNINDLCNCIYASSYLPIYGTKLLVDYKGGYYADGIFTHKTKEPVSKLPYFVFHLDKWRKIPTTWYYVYNDYEWGNKLYEMGKKDAIENLNEIKEFFNLYSSQTYL